MPEPQQSDAKQDWPLLAGRCHPADMRIIDVAAALVRKARGPWVVEVVTREAKKVLEENKVELPAEGAAA